MIGKCLKCTLQKKNNLVLSPHTHLEIYAASLRKHLILMPQKMDAKWLEMSPGVASLPRSQSCYVSVHGCCKNMAGSMGKRPDPSVDVKGSFSPQWGTEITTILNFRWLYTRENVFRLDTPPWTFKNMRIWIGVPSQVECLYTGYMRLITHIKHLMLLRQSRRASCMFFFSPCRLESDRFIWEELKVIDVPGDTAARECLV